MMAKKITRQLVKEKLVPTKKAILKAKDGEEFIVTIKKDITGIMKQDMIGLMRDIIEEKGDEFVPIATIIGLISGVTDIEMGETIDEKIETLYWIEDQGLSEKLAAEIPDSVTDAFDQYLKIVLDLAKKLGEVDGETE